MDILPCPDINCTLNYNANPHARELSRENQTRHTPMDTVIPEPQSTYVDTTTPITYSNEDADYNHSTLTGDNQHCNPINSKLKVE